MFAGALLIALLAAVVLGMVISIRGGPRASRRLRWAAFGSTLIAIAALTPYTVADSGAASLYLLGVPAVAAAVPLIADLIGVARIPADLCGAAVMIGWAVLWGLGIGSAFRPGGVLRIVVLVIELAPRRPSAT
ncbi:MAG TPA: hypothetical protein VES42_20690 [Pilimelia sp.]|nr:hypothetical protein [Pilimelia sp.]